MALAPKRSDVTLKPVNPIRAFVAFALPKEITAAAAHVQERMRAMGVNARWVRPEKIHLTLKFFEALPAADVDAVGKCLTETVRDSGPIALTGRGVGVFPAIRKPRVVWMGLNDPTESLSRLQKKLEAAFSDLGYPAEGRPFTGHLTLGRFRENPHIPALLKALEACRDLETETFTLDAVTLFRSELKPLGPIYTKIMSTSL